MTTKNIPDLVLERYRLQELPLPDAEAIDAMLGADATLRARLGALEASDEALREAIDSVAARFGGVSRPRAGRPALGWALSVAGAVAAVIVLSVTGTYDRIGTAPPEDRVKGGRSGGLPTLMVYRRTNDGSERLSDGAVAHAGDLIRVGYGAAGHSYGIIVSVDGLGNLTRHMPTDGDRAIPLKTDAVVMLDQAYELDDAPRWERFHFVAGQTPFDIGPVLEAVRKGVAPPPGLDQSVFTLRKEISR